MTLSKKKIIWLAGLFVLIMLALPLVNPKMVYKQAIKWTKHQQAIFYSYNFGVPRPATNQISAIDGMFQIYIPAGTFVMGTDIKALRVSNPLHELSLSAYWIDQTEVSNGAYKQCVAAGGCEPPVYHAGNNTFYENSRYDSYPVVYVSWQSAQNYCRWAGRRLPSEAEWEKAARGPDGLTYPWGDSAPSFSLANYGGYIGHPLPVDRYPEGASPFGVLNMAGNVREWVADWFSQSYYLHTPYLDPTGPRDGQKRSLRGGAFDDESPQLSTFNRFEHAPQSPGANRGFRCAQSAP